MERNLNLNQLYREAVAEVARLKRQRADFAGKIERRHKRGEITDAEKAEGLLALADLTDARIRNLEGFIRAAGGTPPDPAREREATAALVLVVSAAVVACLLFPTVRNAVLPYLIMFGVLVGLAVISIALLMLVHPKAPPPP